MVIAYVGIIVSLMMITLRMSISTSQIVGGLFVLVIAGLWLGILSMIRGNVLLVDIGAIT